MPLKWWYSPAGIVAAYALSAVVVVALDRGASLPDAAYTLAFQVCMAGVALVFVRRPADLGLRPMGVSPRRALLWIVAAWVIGEASVALYLAVSDPAPPEVWVEGASGGLLLALTAVIGAPVAEELFWRGLVFRSLCAKLPVPGAIVLSAVLFGFSHWVGGDPLSSVPPRIVYGVLLAWLYARTGSLYPGIVLHAWLNSALAAYVVPEIGAVASGAAMLGVAWALVASTGDPRSRAVRRRTAVRKTVRPATRLP